MPSIYVCTQTAASISNRLLYPVLEAGHPRVNRRPALQAAAATERNNTLHQPVVVLDRHQRSARVAVARVHRKQAARAQLTIHDVRPDARILGRAGGLLDHRQLHLYLDRTLALAQRPSPAGREQLRIRRAARQTERRRQAHRLDELRERHIVCEPNERNVVGLVARRHVKVGMGDELIDADVQRRIGAVAVHAVDFRVEIVFAKAYARSTRGKKANTIRMSSSVMSQRTLTGPARSSYAPDNGRLSARIGSLSAYRRS